MLKLLFSSISISTKVFVMCGQILLPWEEGRALPERLYDSDHTKITVPPFQLQPWLSRCQPSVTRLR